MDRNNVGEQLVSEESDPSRKFPCKTDPLWFLFFYLKSILFQNHVKKWKWIQFVKSKSNLVDLTNPGAYIDMDLIWHSTPNPHLFLLSANFILPVKKTLSYLNQYTYAPWICQIHQSGRPFWRATIPIWCERKWRMMPFWSFWRMAPVRTVVETSPIHDTDGSSWWTLFLRSVTECNNSIVNSLFWNLILISFAYSMASSMLSVRGWKPKVSRFQRYET